MTKLIEGAGVELAVDEHGPPEGAVVLLVHGQASDARAWQPAARDLAAGGLRIVTYDRRGYGRSGAPQPYTGTTVAEQTGDAVAVLDAFAAGPAVVAGDGFGALVALDLALRFPERVRALACADPPLLAFVPDAAQELAAERALLEDALRAGGPAAAVARWLEGRTDADADTLARAQSAARGFFADYAGLSSLAVTRAELRALSVPAVITTGPLTPPGVVAAADALAALLPGARRDPAGDLAGAVRAVTA
ncbi:Putative aminoacrylate hydrolase RutD [Paraconexibacter sp. AEG42_29]|uniref:Aminoacrylate hydrolase RutD n=1 Tax=Paraconexibacter sp. AEG42_29 TaxID=2997339 RepID=A0AAU7AQN0_9ACTN